MNNSEKDYDRVCPLCGTLNRSLYLHETKGLYECEGCGTVIRTTYSGSRHDTASVKLHDKRRLRSVR